MFLGNVYILSFTVNLPSFIILLYTLSNSCCLLCSSAKRLLSNCLFISASLSDLVVIKYCCADLASSNNLPSLFEYCANLLACSTVSPLAIRSLTIKLI